MDADERLLSQYGRMSAEPSPVARMMAAFAVDFRDDVDINLGVGYVNENTIPRAAIEEALHEVLANPSKYRVALNYGGPDGSENLIESIRQFHVGKGVGRLTDEVLAKNRIIVGPNGATSLLESIAHVLKPGIVITADPIYYIYCNFLERLGYEVCAVAEDEHGLDTDRLAAKLEELGSRRREIRFFYVVTVNNPTCTILNTERRRRLVEIAARLSREVGTRIPVFFDKAYEDLIHDPEVERPQSGLLCDKEGLVYEIGTLSKILAPSLRIGYMIGPPGPFVDAMVQRTSDAGFSAPLVTQEMASYLLDRHVAEQIRRVNLGYRDKAAATRQWIDANLGPFLTDVRGGTAGFYYYLTFDSVETHENSAFFRFLSRTTGDPQVDGQVGSKKARVAYIPGEFCAHRRGELVEAGRRQLRLSYGFEELPRICRAIELMKEAAQYAAAMR